MELSPVKRGGLGLGLFNGNKRALSVMKVAVVLLLQLLGITEARL